MTAQPPAAAPSASFAATRHLLVRVALAFVLVSAAFQYIFHGSCAPAKSAGHWSPCRQFPPLTPEYLPVRLDPYKCRSVFHGGSWTSTNSRHPYSRWSPLDSRLYEPSSRDVSDCLAGRHVVFVGDSWTRQLFWATANRLDRTKQEIAMLDFYLAEEKQTDLHFDHGGVKVDFVWDPWLNSTAFTDQLDKFRKTPEEVSFANEGKISPGLLVVAAPGLWAARHGGDAYADLFRSGVNKVLPYMKEDLDMAHTRGLGNPTKWLPNQLVVLPVPVPDYKRLTRDRRDTITSDRIRDMNGYLASWTPAAQTHIPWVFNQMVEGFPDAYNEDGLHVAKDVRERAVSVLLNARCNAGLKPDLQRTTSLGCVSYDRPSIVQLGVLIVCVITVGLGLLKREDTALTAAVDALTPLASAALLSYAVEKTHAFIKADRLQSGAALGLLLAGFAIASAASLRRLDTGAAARLMAREHTDECKGFLQALILLLNYFDAASSLGGHKALRLAIAAYLFLSSYGHATYFLTTGDYSFRRVATVLLRLNLLNALLTFALDSSFTAYYFTPLVSLWFLATYAVLAVRKQDNHKAGILVGKVVGAALLANLVVFPTELVKHALNFVNTVSRSSWDTWATNQQLAKDGIVPFVGILAACVAHLAAQPQSEPAETAQDRVSKIVNGLILKVSDMGVRVGNFRLGLYTAFNIAVLALLSFFLFVVVNNKNDYNQYHLFLSPLLVLSATHLRSSLPILDSAYLALPASLGTTALETYLLHHHIWLSSRGTTLLAIWPLSTNPLGTVLFYAQKIFLTVLFLGLAGKVHDATRAAVSLILGSESAPAEDSAERGEKRIKIGGSKVALLGDVRMRALGVVVALCAANLLYGL